jgi:hypothetical protein
MSETVTIVSKLPMSLNMQLQTETTVTMRNGPNTWQEPVWRYSGKAYTIRGTAVPNGQIPARYVMPPRVADGTATLTHGIPRTFAEQWFHQQAGADFVKNRLVYMSEHKDSSGEARERQAIRTGFEALEPPVHDNQGNRIGGDARWPKRRTAASFLGAGDPDSNTTPTE